MQSSYQRINKSLFLSTNPIFFGKQRKVYLNPNSTRKGTSRDVGLFSGLSTPTSAPSNIVQTDSIISLTASDLNIGGTLTNKVNITKDVVVSGKLTANLASGTGLAVTADATVGGNLSVTGALTAASVNGVSISTSTLSGSNSGDVTLGNVSSTGNSKGATITGQSISLTFANSTNPGLMSTSAQTFAGIKTFNNSITAFNLSGTNTGDVSLGNISTTSNAKGATLSGQALSLTVADGTNPGIVSTTDQTFSGVKTFVNGIAVSGNVSANTFNGGTFTGSNNGDVTLTAPSATSNANGATLSGQALTLTFADPSNPGIISTGAQTIAGLKTFVSGLSVSGDISANTFNGKTFNGDVTITAPSATPNANGATISSQALTLTFADPFNPGIISTGAQTIAGNKTFVSNMTIAAVLNVGDVNSASNITCNGYLNSALSTGTGLMVASSGTIGGTLAVTGAVTGASFNGVTINTSVLSGTNTGNVTMSAPSATSNSNGGTINGSQSLSLTFADGTNPGILSTGAQTIAGAKTFSNVINATAATGTGLAVTSNATVGGTLAVTGAVTGASFNGVTINTSILSGTNTGNVSMNAPSATSNSNGGFINGSQSLTLTFADGTNPGILSTSDQTIAGNKTFVSNVTISGNLTANTVNGVTISTSTLSGTNTGDVSLTAPSATSSANGATLSGQALTLTLADGTNPGLISTGAQSLSGLKTFTGGLASSTLSVSSTSTFTGAITANGGALLPTTGGTAANLNYYEEYSNTTGTFSGASTTALAGSIYIVRVGKCVTLSLRVGTTGSASGTANTTASFFTYSAALPSRFVPTNGIFYGSGDCTVISGGAVTSGTFAVSSSTFILTLGTSFGSTFATTSTNGIRNFSFGYYLY